MDPLTSADRLIDKLATLPDESSRRQWISDNQCLQCTGAVTNLTERVRSEIRVNTERALKLADAAISIAEMIGSQEALAQSFRAKANAFYASGDYPHAIELHERAAASFEAAGNQNELARTISSCMQPLLLQGHYDKALETSQRARQIFTVQGNHWRLARLDINVGNVYFRQDRFVDALACYERAYKELLNQNDAEGLAAVLSNLAVCYTSIHEFPRALETYQQARHYCQEHGMPLLVVQADYNIAYLYFLRGEYGRAIAMLRSARESAKQLGDAYHGSLSNLDLAELYLELNLHAEAAELAHEAEAGFHKLAMGYERAKAMAFAAIAASQQGQAVESLKLFSEAKAGFIGEKNQVWPSLIDLYQALVLYNEGRLFEARRLCSEAFAFFAKSSLRGKAAIAELLLGRISLRMGDVSNAMQHCCAVLEQVARLEAPVLTYQAEFLAGQVHESAGNAAEAYACYRRAREALEILRGSLRGEELKISFFKDKLELYERLVDICLQRRTRDSSEEAFAYIEQAKSRVLMDLLSRPVQTPLQPEAGVSQLVRSIRNLREELNWYYNLIEREQLRPERNSAQKIEDFEQQARARETDLTRALREATIAEANQAGLPTPSNVPLQHIREVLPSDTVLIEYFRLQDKNLACVLSRENLEILPITLQSRITSLLRLLQFQLSKFRLDPQYVSSFGETMLRSTRSHLKALYDELIGPIAHLLTGHHVIFIPHDVLHYIPLHALYDGERYLIERFSVSYAPSASIYSLCQTLQPNTSGHALVMGISDPQAPSILDEVKGLATVLPNAKLYVGDFASEQVLRTSGPKSRIVHIATHGYFRQDNPLFSSIRLGRSYLSLYDLYQLKLPADLVVLSGCATGVNAVTAGDELIGMARGLLQAGAKSLMLSLWDVHDESTTDFMMAFYRCLNSGISKAEALQQAMRQVREQYPHPYYWAPFVLIGSS